MNIENVFLDNKIKELYKSLSSDYINLYDIKKNLYEVKNINTSNEVTYLRNMIYPEKALNAKVPSKISQNTCSFKLHYSDAIWTNWHGALVIRFSPNFLASDSLVGKRMVIQNQEDFEITDWSLSLVDVSTFWWSNAAMLDGDETQYYMEFQPLFIGQMLKKGFYSQYRLVSASMELKYLGPTAIAKGSIGGAITFDENTNIGAATQEGPSNTPYDPQWGWDISNFADFVRYSNFNNLRRLPYFKEKTCLDGIRMLYFPVDSSYDNFTKIYSGDGTEARNGYGYGEYWYEEPCVFTDPSIYKSGFTWVVFCYNCPPQEQFKVDITCNYECLPFDSVLNYMPYNSERFNITRESRDVIEDFVQQNCVQ